MNPEWVVVDIEGNGSVPPEIVEISVTCLDDALAVAGQDCWLVKPATPIHWRARQVHGISNEAVRDAPSLADAADSILAAISDKVLVAHNAPVEVSVLRRQLPDWRPAGVIDTLKLAKKFFPDAPGYGLVRLLEWLGVDLGAGAGAAHRASYDGLATAALLGRIVDRAEECGLVRRSLVGVLQLG